MSRRMNLYRQTLDPYAGLKKDLFAYYSFEGNALDSSGNGHHGTVYGATTVSGKLGNCLSFDGVNDYVGFSSFPFPANSAVTVSFWAYISSADSQTSRFFTNLTGVNELFSCIMVTEENQILFDYGDYPGDRLGASYSGKYDKMTHIVCVDNGVNFNGIYLDGVLANSRASSNPPSAITAFWIGSAEAVGGWLKGKPDEMGFWTRALTSTEIAQLYNGGNALKIF